MKLTLKDFLKKCNLKNDTKTEGDLPRIYNFFIHPRDSKIYSDKVFIKNDNGQIGGSLANHSVLSRLLESLIFF